MKQPFSLDRKTCERLVAAAKEAKSKAYAPYSNFNVGAALLTAAGDIILGCNVENGSYPNGICAERTAVVSAVAQGHKDFAAIAVIAESAHPVTPCGMCRQVLSEFNPSIPVLCCGSDGGYKVISLDALLTHQFSL